MTARWAQITEVGGKVCATRRTVLLRIRDAQITPDTTTSEMPKVVQRPMRRLVRRPSAHSGDTVVVWR